MSTQTPIQNPISWQYKQAIEWIEIADPGSDSFLKDLKVKVLNKAKLSPKQITWLIRKFNSAVNKQVHTNNSTALPNNKPVGEQLRLCNYVLNYKGTFKFMLDLQSKYNANKALSPAQWVAVEKCFNRDVPSAALKTQAPYLAFANPVPVVLTRKGAMALKKKYNLSFGPFTVEILGAYDAVKRRGYRNYVMRVNASGAVNVCRVCGKSLVDHKSVVSGIGPVCAKNLGAIYHTYQTDIQKFMADFATQCSAIGNMEIEFNSYAFKDGYQLLDVAIDTAKQTNSIATPPVAVSTINVTSSTTGGVTPAPVLQPTTNPIPTLRYQPSTKLIKVKDCGVNQQLELRIDEIAFQDMMVAAGIGMVKDKFNLHNIDTGNTLEFTRVNSVAISSTFKSQIGDKAIFFFIIP